ncbi:hypothetical protein PQR14_10285 [Paraburkholderia bryophila]|uniref:hypothetical protein n=1 Tax=Burkholderiaceae TaxID=119060 RepID=UPI0012E030F5|nr:hypothetical protein [Burkholderia sp. 9120]
MNGVKTEDWLYRTDETGNLQIAQELVSHWLLGEFDRDTSNRVTRVTGNSREARFTYDKRGRITRFTYNEDATVLTAGLKRFLTVDYSYTPDGRVASRTGSVARNGGTAEPISSEEVDQWIGNYENGVDPVGPTVNPLGSPRSLEAFLSRAYIDADRTAGTGRRARVTDRGAGAGAVSCASAGTDRPVEARRSICSAVPKQRQRRCRF